MCTTASAQNVQWSSHELIGNGHYDNQIFSEALGNEELVSVFLEKQPNGNPLLVIDHIDDCGIQLKRYDIDYLNFSPKWLLNIARDQSGNLYICGLADSTMPYGSLFVLKIDPTFMPVWSKRYTTNVQPYPYSFHINQQDELFVLFNTTDQSHGNSLLKLNTSGDIVWAKSMGYSPIWGRGSPTDDGGYLMSSGSFVFKVNAQGVMQWRTIVNNGHVISNVLSIDGGYIFYHQRDAAVGVGRVVMLNEDGTFRWASSSYNGFRGILARQIDSNKVEFIATGRTNDLSAPTSAGICLMRINTSGNVEGIKYFNNQSDDIVKDGIDLVETKSGVSYIAQKITRSGNSAIQYMRLPKNLDSMECYTEYSFSNIDATTVIDDMLPTLPSLNMTFTVDDFSIYISPRPRFITLTRTCSKWGDVPSFSLGSDTLLCPDEQLNLTGPPGLDYNWSTGDDIQQISVDKSGWYWLTASLACDGDSLTDSIYIDIIPDPQAFFDGVSTEYTLNDSLNAIAYANGNGTFYWYLNDTLIDSGQVLTYPLYQAGNHTLELIFIDENGCSFYFSKDFLVSLQIPEMPNVFSPNGDGTSDAFLPFHADGAHYQMQIYNRFGRLLADKVNQSWDGRTSQNEIAAAGVYFYVLYWQDNPQPFRGSFTLIR